MKILFSPTKSQYQGSGKYSFPQASARYPEKTNQLESYLQKYSKSQLGSFFKTSSKKTDEIYTMIHQKKHAVPAMELFSGTSFGRLDIDSYGDLHLEYLQKKVCILSAYYGVLEPFDQVSAYRLDMTDKILPPNTLFKNLYDFWKQEVFDYFSTTETIINLASSEYSKMLSKEQQKRMITIHFLVEEKDVQKSISVYAKQQRGQMLDYMIKNNITHPKDLYLYKFEGFVFDKTFSDANNYYFIQKK